MFPDFFGQPCKIFLVYYRLKSSVYFDHMKHTSAILRALNDECTLKGTELNAEEKKLLELIEENGILGFVHKNIWFATRPLVLSVQDRWVNQRATLTTKGSSVL